MSDSFYTDLAPLYDRMIPWARRLEREGPQLRAILGGAHSVLDAACGTGAHVEWLAAQALRVAGADASASMIAQARRRLETLPEATRPALYHATWEQLPGRVPGSFDAVLCLGNSLPYADTGEALTAALAGLWSRVAPGGRLLIQFKNFARRLQTEQRWLPLTAQRDAATGDEFLFVRQYDWRGDRVEFTILMLTRPAGGDWAMQPVTSILTPWTADDVTQRLEALGAQVALHGALDLAPFEPEAAEDVVLLAHRD